MPAHDWEVDAAEEEGVHLHPGRTFEQILGDQQGHVRGVECQRVESFSFDESGRLIVEKIPDSAHKIECDTVIFSVGQRAGLAFIPDDAGVGITRNQTIAINPNTLAATREGVFAAGDSVSGTAFVIEAVNSGHTAARSIIRYLQGKHLEPPRKPDLPVVHFSQQEIQDRIKRGEIKPTPRIPLPELTVGERVDNFYEVERGYDEKSAMQEAERCLSCGICSECMSCVFACGRDAIIHEDISRTSDINVGAIILAPGYQIYNANLSEEFGLGRYSNVVTSLQYERMLSASGPTKGHIKRPGDGKSPKRVAFIQCVGSRDQSHDYCSSVCCMYAAKEAIMTIEHARAEALSGQGDGNVFCQVFFMDTRSYSKGYEEYYRRAEKKYGVKYTRCRISDIKENAENGNLIVKSIAPYEGANQLVQEEFDLVVLSVGMEISESVKTLGRRLGIELDNYGFCHTTLFNPLNTSREGIYVAGPFREPKDIPETVIEASGAAAGAARLLAPSRYSLAVKQEYPPEKNITGEEPRIGVFVCHCGSNIGGYLDVPEVAKFAKTLPGVLHAENNLYTCSQDTIAHIIEQIKELRLNRVVVSSCTPLTHEPLFQDALRQAGLNPHLFEMANIRNQCSWVHSNDWNKATAKAKQLTRMAVAKAQTLEPLKISEVPVNNAALIIGGGAAGLSAALTLADQGFPVHIIEREGKLGGNLKHLYFFVGTNGDKPRWTPQEYLAESIYKVREHPLITIHLNTELVETTGFKGNFTSTLNNGQKSKVQHGIIIVATGGEEYKGSEYGYGQSDKIITQLEFERHIANTVSPDELPDNVVMIQCVGPSERYCSRLCCTTAFKNALKLKEMKPDADITILYRDIRTYGFKERLYTKAREEGIRFIHFEFNKKPEVIIDSLCEPHSKRANSEIAVQISDPILRRHIELKPDLLVLSTPIVASRGTKDLANKLKLSLDMDGFFLEAHVKLRPVDFAADGIYMAGLAHYPKFLDETIAQAQAAASRAAGILSQKTMLTNARVAVVDPQLCVGCLTCVRICPFDVPKVKPDYNGVGNISGAAYIEAAVCHGCGTCASECPAQAIQLMHYKDVQTLTKLDALFAEEKSTPGVIPIESIDIT
jgi:heterodisulfide reductase subunit A-like polyferredoxin